RPSRKKSGVSLFRIQQTTAADTGNAPTESGHVGLGAGRFRCHSCGAAMVGRERELEEGRRFLGALAHGSACLVLEGEPGIGKTTVWRETVALAEGWGYRVLACRPAAAEAKLSFAGLADLLSGVEGELLDRLPVPQRYALEVALLQAAPGPHTSDPR